jgi:hypothetical protein
MSGPLLFAAGFRLPSYGRFWAATEGLFKVEIYKLTVQTVVLEFALLVFSLDGTPEHSRAKNLGNATIASDSPVATPGAWRPRESSRRDGAISLRGGVRVCCTTLTCNTDRTGTPESRNQGSQRREGGGLATVGLPVIGSGWSVRVKASFRSMKKTDRRTVGPAGSKLKAL